MEKKRLIHKIQKKHVENVKEATTFLRKEYKKNLTIALSTGLALIIGLYIKDLLTLWLEYLLNILRLDGGVGLMYKTILTLIVIAIAVFGIVLVSKWANKGEKK